MLTDTGPVLALLDEGDKHHTSCLKVVKGLPKAPLITTWPCFTEAMYFLGDTGGYRYQARLWMLCSENRLVLIDLSSTETDRMDELMRTYRNVPMDLADASLVAVAESRNQRRVFTIDSDFYIYRLTDGSMLEVVR